MKRTVGLLLAVAVLFGLSACGKKLPENQEGTTAPVVQSTSPTDPTGNGEAVQVGQILSQPEKTVSLEDLTELTLRVQTQSSYEVNRTVTYALRVQGERVTFYERNTESDFFVEEFYGFESLCIADGDAVSHYSNSRISGTGFTPVSFAGEYDTDDGYFRNQLACLGIDYQDWIDTDGFTKCEDTTVMGVECYVYTLAFTDHFGEGYKAKICVDKNTGLWLSMERELPGTEDVFSMEVQEVLYSAEVIPGAAYTTIPQQGIYENDGVSVTVTALDFSDPDCAVLKLETTNTNDTDVRLSSHYVLVNGLCVGGNMMEHICPAGETVRTEVALSNAVLDRAGIDVFESIGFDFWIEQIHMEGDDPVSDGILVENMGELKVRIHSSTDSQPDASGKGHLLLEGSDLLLRLESLKVEDNGAAWLNVYCENGWTEPVQVEVSVKALNGSSCAYSGRITMQEEQKGFGGFAIPHETLVELGIDSIENVELTYEVFLGDALMSTECIVERSEVMAVELYPEKPQN